jgi:hypothetical protein
LRAAASEGDEASDDEATDDEAEADERERWRRPFTDSERIRRASTCILSILTVLGLDEIKSTAAREFVCDKPSEASSVSDSQMLVLMILLGSSSIVDLWTTVVVGQVEIEFTASLSGAHSSGRREDLRVAHLCTNSRRE